ncbi:hypothetical protein CDAR_113911 [Caerostris darwini]|uniref:Uncharacterized protein n=1 Tax=Caerostris darwini TaxID=1538125 RepID=A0AAV4SVM7_9ARAC|nr:hypothetical protein CDAR_113911 [Caerostris darwini]
MYFHWDRIPMHLKDAEAVAIFRLTNGHDYMYANLHRNDLSSNGTCLLCRTANRDDDLLQNFTELIDRPDDITAHDLFYGTYSADETFSLSATPVKNERKLKSKSLECPHIYLDDALKSNENKEPSGISRQIFFESLQQTILGARRRIAENERINRRQPGQYLYGKRLHIQCRMSNKEWHHFAQSVLYGSRPDNSSNERQHNFPTIVIFGYVARPHNISSLSDSANENTCLHNSHLFPPRMLWIRIPFRRQNRQGNFAPKRISPATNVDSYLKKRKQYLKKCFQETRRLFKCFGHKIGKLILNDCNCFSRKN